MGRKRFQWSVFVVAAICVQLGLGYAWTDLELTDICGLSPKYRSDGYLEVIVDWKSPDVLANFLSRLIRIEGFSLHDSSGQFAYNGQLYAVIEQERETNFLQTLDTDEKVLTEALRGTLSDYGLFPIRGETPDRRRFFLYCGITYTGRAVSTEKTGPYVVELTYSVLGLRRTAHKTAR